MIFYKEFFSEIEGDDLAASKVKALRVRQARRAFSFDADSPDNLIPLRGDKPVESIDVVFFGNGMECPHSPPIRDLTDGLGKSVLALDKNSSRAALECANESQSNGLKLNQTCTLVPKSFAQRSWSSLSLTKRGSFSQN